MRKFINIKKNRQVELSYKFPYLLELAYVDETPEYTYLAVSVFDRWLGREDAIKLLGDISKEEQARRDALLYSFSKKVAQSTEVLNFKFRGKWKKAYPLFRGFTSEESKQEYLKPVMSHTRKSFFQVVLPEIDAVFFESWDNTNVFYLRDPSKIEIIKKWAAETGVYCLEK
jgi:hypothetical protein